MQQQEFAALVERMEALAARRPAAYRWRVLGLAALGYGYLVLVVVALLLLCGLLVAGVMYLKAAGVKLLIIVGALLWAVLRALWVNLAPPTGEAVTRAGAPELHALLDGLRARLQTPPVHVILLTPEFNAGVTQLPRLGIFGWHRNYLLLGLPLLRALSVEQFTAVLAHELGHLSRGHARTSNWIYRLRLIWSRLEHEFTEHPRAGGGLVRGFFRWYIPYFNACSFPLARANEYEADATSARLTSARSAAQALTGVHLIGRYLEERFWPGIYAAAREQPQPAFAPYRSFDARGVQQLPEGELQRWEQSALAQSTSLADTHPSLADRLRALGAPAEFAPPPAGAGADSLLGASRERLVAALDDAWRARIGDSWRQHHEQVQAARTRLGELRAGAAADGADESAGLERADLEESVGEGAEAALRLREALRARHPESNAVRFALARQLLSRDESAGVALMEAVIAADEGALGPAAEALRDYHWRRGEPDAARTWHERHVHQAARLEEARSERGRVLLADRWLPHGLDADALDALRSQLRAVPDLRRAYLVRKQVRQFPESPCYVLGFTTRGFLQLIDYARRVSVQQAVTGTVQCPGETLVFCIEGTNWRFARKYRRVRDARIL
ncbi:MAG: M48 family metalloprotease [Steroidobacteraceae bacterium]